MMLMLLQMLLRCCYDSIRYNGKNNDCNVDRILIVQVVEVSVRVSEMVMLMMRLVMLLVR